MHSERSVALLTINDTWFKSRMKLDCPTLDTSESWEMILVKILSVRPTRQLSAGTKQPTCARYVMRATLLR